MAIGAVQTKSQLTDAGGATTQLSFLSLPTAGNGIIIDYAADSLGGGGSPVQDPTIADNQGVGNVYSKAVAGNDAANGEMAAVWRCDAIGATSGTFTITVTHAASSNNYSLIAIQEVNEGITLDKTATTTTTVVGVTTVTGTTLSSSDELIHACYAEDSSRGDSGLTCATGYSSSMFEKDSNNHISASGNYKVVASTTAPTAVYTVSTTGFTDAVAVLATFQPAAAGTTAALTGQAATFSAGSLTANLAIPLTGKSAAFSQGTLTSQIAPPLTGQAATFAQGALTANMSIALSGQPATFTPGTLTPNLSIPLTGLSFAFTQGSVTPSSSTDVTAALTGQTFTFSQTSPTADLTATLTGQLFTFSQGTVSPASADVIAPITGQRASFSQGRLTPLVENRGRSSRHQRPWWYRNYDDELERLERERRERVRLGIITIPQSRRIKQLIETAQEDLEEALLFAMNEQLVESARVMQSVSGRIDKLVARLHIERKRKEEQDIEDDDEEIVLSLLPYM